MKSETVTCNDNGTRLESELWKPGVPVSIMWMPAGVHSICAGFRNGSIELTVKCDKSTVEAVQASLEAWRSERPRQECFGCIEHQEREASFRVSASCGFQWSDDGVYLTAEPTTLGAQNVNGKIHRSWSPSFTTDADYSKATEHNGVLTFPEGARGSRSNPASITGVDFCVGTLTNKPAFHEIAPVKAREAGDAVTAAGTSEGARKGWLNRGGYIETHSDRNEMPTAAEFTEKHKSHDDFAKFQERLGTRDAWATRKGADAYKASSTTKTKDDHIDAARRHAEASEAHGSMGQPASSNWHAHIAKLHMKAAGVLKASEGDAASPDSIRAHCRLTLLQDVPDATDAEVAQYEAEVEGGGSHSDAVIKLRSARQNGFKTTGSEKPTLDTIAAKHAAAVEAANRIAAEHGAAKLTAADVYERFSVKGTWSDAARKAAAESRKLKHPGWSKISSLYPKEKQGLAYIHDGFIKNTQEGKSFQQAFDDSAENENYYGGRADIVADRRHAAAVIMKHHGISGIDHTKLGDDSKTKASSQDLTLESIAITAHCAAAATGASDAVRAAWSNEAREAARLARSRTASQAHGSEMNNFKSSSDSYKAHEASESAYFTGDSKSHKEAYRLHKEAASTARKNGSAGLADQHEMHAVQHGSHAGVGQRVKATDATPQDILNKIYARAGENR